MLFSPEQDRALESVSDWLKKKDKPVYRLFGYAGTGKTTLARHFASNVEGKVLFGAYTGKAAYVLRTKGCEGASTIHSMIYNARNKDKKKLENLEEQYFLLVQELKNEYGQDYSVSGNKDINDLKHLIETERKHLSNPSFSLNSLSEIKNASLVVIDECSMVDERMGNDLLTFKVPILVLGDPAQLPPVKGGGFFTNVEHPDFMLTEIHRQARDNPILELATLVRTGKPISLGQYGDSSVVSSITAKDALGVDQILVGKNATRHSSNKRMRSLKGIDSEYPTQNDRLVCLRNDHNLGLLNGTLWTVKERHSVDEDAQKLTMSVVPEDIPTCEPLEVEAHIPPFLGTGDKMAWWERKEAQEFGYGYALTVHKSQGSQWDNVLLIDESGSFHQDAKRWLYTGITRAAKKIKIFKSN